MAHSLKLNDEETVAFNFLCPSWLKIPISIRPDEDHLKIAITDYLAENRVLENALGGNIPEKKPALHFSLQQGAEKQPYIVEELRDKRCNVEFRNTLIHLKMAGLNPIQDLKPFGLDEESVFDATYLAANLFVALPIIADCHYMTFVDTELFHKHGYEVLCVERHLNFNVGLKDMTTFWRGYELGSLVYEILKKLPQGSVSSNELIEPMNDLKSIADKDTFIHYLSKVTLSQLKKKPLHLSEKAISGLRKSILFAANNLFREKCLLVPYPNNRTLDLLYSRKTVRNNVLVRPPVLSPSYSLKVHAMLQKAITGKKLTLFSDGPLLFKENNGYHAMRLPTSHDVKKAIAREGLGIANSYDLMILQIGAIEYDQRTRTGVPFSSVPYECLATCKRLFDESWMDEIVALKFDRLLTGQYSLMGNLDMQRAHHPYQPDMHLLQAQGKVKLRL
ncbi:hypothetical protein K7432_008165 [Basidiobolus ranarum]|uniref:Uncharacterized protein n=1 Tax=Basidiobolus ranarum TaxID=34480 RepID=A0ABR2VZX9_9FUNG